MHRPLVLAAILLIAAPCVARAGEPEEAVRYFYGNVGSETDPDNRDRFADPARAVLDRNERRAADGGARCVDFILGMDSRDVDQEGLAATLGLAESVSGGQAAVTATFSLFGEPHEVDWTLKRVGAEWKISDVASPTGNWRLSRLACG